MKVFDYAKAHTPMENDDNNHSNNKKMESSIFNILVLIDAIRRKVELMTIFTWREWWLVARTKQQTV